MKKKVYIYPNGATIIYTKDKRNNYSAVYAGFISGSIKNEQNGVAHFVEHMMFKQTEHLTISDINKERSVITSLNASTGRNDIIVRFCQTNRLFERAMKLVADMLLFTDYDSKEIEVEKQVIKEEYTIKLDRINHDISSQATYNFTNALQPQETLGSHEDIEKISKDHLINYKQKNFGLNNFIISYCGNFSFRKVKKMVEKYFLSKLKETSEAEKNQLVPTIITSEPKLVVHTNDSQKVEVFCGFRHNFEPMNYFDEDLIEFLNRFFNRGANGWHNKLRDEGLVYMCKTESTVYMNKENNAMYVFRFTTNKDNLTRCFELIKDCVKNITTTDLPDENFEDIKNNKIYSYDEIHSPNKEIRANSNLRQYLTHGKLRKQIKLKRKIKRIKNLTKYEFKEYANKVFAKLNEPYVVIMSGYKKEELLSYDEIVKILND